MALLEVRDLRAGYGRTEVLRGVDLTVPEGATVVLLGANGAGKTTLLRTIAGLVPMTAGRIRFRGEDVGRLSTHRRARRGVCLIPEGRGIFRRLTVRENLVVQAEPGGLPGAVDRAAALFPVLGDRLDQPAGTLSGGQQQMLAIGQALMARPKLLMLDEPSAGLAPAIVAEVMAAVTGLAAAGIGILLVEQAVEAAVAAADRVCVLDVGRVVLDRPASEVDDVKILKEAYFGRPAA
jgi:branched-chain amino acid transport system ATP-binding protein